MNPRNPRQLAAMLLLCTFPLIQACSTADDRAYVRSYEEAYKKKVEYTSHLVRRDGFHIHAREFGVKSGRPTIVMMHGFPDSLHLYDRLAPLLAAGHHVVTFYFLGWGDSDNPPDHDYDVASLRRDLEAVIKHFGLKRLVLVVHDASGQLGIDWALENPAKTAGMVLLNTYYGPAPTLKAPEAIACFSTPGIRRDLSVWVTRHFDSLWMEGYSEQLAKFISTKELREPFQKLLGYQSLQIRPAFYGLNRVLREELGKRRQKMQQLQRFQPPVRIIFGNDDPCLNAGVARDLNRLFPHSELFLVKDAGHFVQIDKPEVLAELIRGFPPSSRANPNRKTGGRNEAD